MGGGWNGKLDRKEGKESDKLEGGETVGGGSRH